MSENGRFSPGQTAVVREIWNGRAWRGGAYRVIQDNPGLVVLYAPLGTIIKYPLMPDGKRVKPHQKMNSEWVLTELKADKFITLRLSIPGAGYTVLMFRNHVDLSLRAWYINLEDPMHRTHQGFDLTDDFLDVIVKPDLSGWFWKDEDEFAEAIDLKMISQEKARAMRLEGERVANWIQSGQSPFNGWKNWKPDPSWEVPVLPDGWDKI
jgi:hypothetical protein